MPANVNWGAVALASPVIVMYMSVKHLGEIAAALMEGVRQEGTTVKGNSRLEKRFAEAMESVAGEIEFIMLR